MHTMRLLIVDNERDFLTYTSRRFRRRNVHVYTADTGDEALRMIASIGFDVAVLDVHLPGMGGLDMLERIQALSPKTRVILLTGHASTEAAARGMARGAFEYMLRPVRFEELYFKVLEAARAAGSCERADGP